jgi:hypothetical protein
MIGTFHPIRLDKLCLAHQRRKAAKASFRKFSLDVHSFRENETEIALDHEGIESFMGEPVAIRIDPIPLPGSGQN